MAEDPRIRTPRIRVELIRWNWSTSIVDQRDSTPIDLTADGSVINYRWQKSIKTPMSSAQLTLIPQRTDVHILDIVSIMDVIRIYEFGKLRFQGYVRTANYSGSINPSTGAPSREAILTITGFGGLFQEAQIGLGLGRVVGNATSVIDSAAKLKTAIANSLDIGTTYGLTLKTLLDNWFTFVEEIGNNAFRTYVDTYIDYAKAVDLTSEPALPRTFDLYTGAEESISLWSIAQQVIEMPLNELWLDVGPRDFYVDNVKVPTAEDKTHVVFRETPFDDFSAVPTVSVKKRYLSRFDLSKSRDEAYSVYFAVPSAFAPNEQLRVMLGEVSVDQEAVNKYLYRPLINQLFYTRMEEQNSTSLDSNSAELASAAQNISTQLKTWFQNNDRYYSGAITMLVPDEERTSDKDIKIGERVNVEGINGSFYVEGVAHTWQYSGTLMSTLSVTRGWDYLNNQPMEFKDAIFKGGVIQ